MKYQRKTHVRSITEKAVLPAPAREPVGVEKILTSAISMMQTGVSVKQTKFSLLFPNS